MTIYISGPMTGIPDENRPAFNKVAQSLRAAGWDVFNPAENGLPTTATWVQHMRVDIAALMRCDSIVLLPGWQDSKGATLEYIIAQDLGMAVYQYSRVPAKGIAVVVSDDAAVIRFSQQTQPPTQSLEDRFLQAWSRKRFLIESGEQADQQNPAAEKIFIVR